MIIIQDFPSIAALVGWLHNAQLRQGRRNFANWLAGYTRNRELVVNGRTYRFADCINLLKAEDLFNV